MKTYRLLLAISAALAPFLTPVGAAAATYDVHRFFSDGPTNATLTGTLELPLGSYTIMDRAPSPFAAVNLTLTVNGVSYSLHNALTDVIFGTGQFFIEATADSLIFNTANADGSNPADLVFSDNLDPQAHNRYAIGWNGAPGFEVAYTEAGDLAVPATFPTVFAVVPEPSTMTLLATAMGLLATRTVRRRRGAA